MVQKSDFRRVDEYIWELPQDFRDDMRVPARLFGDAELFDAAFRDRTVEQLINTSTLPGLVKYALAMPDFHQGYGFPIGGVAAMRLDTGVISPGGVGYDVNCGKGAHACLRAGTGRAGDAGREVGAEAGPGTAGGPGPHGGGRLFARGRPQ